MKAGVIWSSFFYTEFQKNVSGRNVIKKISLWHWCCDAVSLAAAYYNGIPYECCFLFWQFRFQSSFRLMSLGEQRSMPRGMRPLPPRGNTWLGFQRLASAQPSPGYVAIWAVNNKQTEDLSLSVALSV